ncbi:DJ-1/PfpI family protein, partial [Rhizobium ruizarguesonis]
IACTRLSVRIYSGPRPPAQKKPIFTICHGVQILIAVDGVVRGKKVGAIGACEPEVTLAGGTYIDLSPPEAYIDGTMVSAT